MLTAWQSAQGDSPPANLACAATVTLNSVDTNNVVITGTGTISSFGPAGQAPIDGSLDANENPIYTMAPWPVTKRVIFVPSGGSITLQNGANLVLLGAATRVVPHKSFGIYSCDTTGVWTELSFTDTTVAAMTKTPTVVAFKTPGTFTYTPAPGVKWIRVRGFGNATSFGPAAFNHGDPDVLPENWVWAWGPFTEVGELIVPSPGVVHGVIGRGGGIYIEEFYV